MPLATDALGKAIHIPFYTPKLAIGVPTKRNASENLTVKADFITLPEIKKGLIDGQLTFHNTQKRQFAFQTLPGAPPLRKDIPIGPIGRVSRVQGKAHRRQIVRFPHMRARNYSPPLPDLMNPAHPRDLVHLPMASAARLRSLTSADRRSLTRQFG